MTIKEIMEKLKAEGDDASAISRAIGCLTELIDANPEDEAAIIERGKLYWRINDRAHCITDYNRAAELNPHGDAPNLLRMTYDILDFYNKDLFNP